MHTPTVLIVDDEMLNIELAGAYLKEEGYKVLFARNASKALELLEEYAVDLILLDINMPEIDGFTLCKMIKGKDHLKEIPVLFLTAQTDIEFLTEAFALGGVDYITKPFHPLEFKARIKTHLENRHLLEELKTKQNKLAQLSISDPLTKLYNTLYFEAQLNTRLKKENLWVLFIKIDKLDKLNRIYGFLKTNKILRLFAKLLQENCYSNAKVARLYGGSFGIIYKDYRQNEIEHDFFTLKNAFKKNQLLYETLNIDVVLYHVPKGSDIVSFYTKLQSALLQLEHTAKINHILLT